MINLFIASNFEAEYFIEGLKRISDSVYEGNYRVIITGPGMVNMTAAVTSAAGKYPGETFINIGIAGSQSSKYKIGAVKEIQRFSVIDPSQKTAQASKIMAEAYPAVESGQGISLMTSVCPVWNDHPFTVDAESLVDMEGYAFAKICSGKGIDFNCFKAVSDNLQKNSQEEFLSNARKALQSLKVFLIENILP